MQIGIDILSYRAAHLRLPKGFVRHRVISIPTVTVMAVATDLHRTFLIPELLPDNAPFGAILCFYSFVACILTQSAKNVKAYFILFKAKSGNKKYKSDIDSIKSFCYNGTVSINISEVITMKTIAIIGCGRIAQHAHFPALSTIENVKIKYACDLIPEKAQAMKDKYPTLVDEVITDYTVALADKDVESVFVLTPTTHITPLPWMLSAPASMCSAKSPSR